MCLMIYLAADRPLEMVDWNDHAPGFYVEALDAQESRVRRNFAKPHVVYAGSHEGCGCGFRVKASAPDPRSAQRASRRRSLEQLSSYLEREVARVGTIELLVCRDGEQGKRPAMRRTLTPESLEDEAFSFLDSELALVEMGDPHVARRA